MKRNYDTIAFFYDRLARLVYGKALLQARRYLVDAIPADSKILIAGGGTGWELEELSKKYPSGITFTYVDASTKMTALAAKRNIATNKVTFIVASIEAAMLDGQYDVVIAPFLFDNFTDKSLQKIFLRLHDRLRPSGLWLYCDFRNTEVVWQKLLLKIMYHFFRLFCGIEATKLPDAESLFAAYNYEISGQRFFLHNFITSIIYKKSAGHNPS